MDNETVSDYIIVAVFVMLIMIGSYGSYRLGKMTERKALTAALVSNIEAAYWEGYTDCLTGLKGAHESKKVL